MTIPDLRVQMIRELNYTNFFGRPKEYVDLEPQQQIEVWWRMKHFIVTNPTEFTPEQVEIARKSLNREPNAPTLNDVSIAAQVSDFGSAFVEEAKQKLDLGGGILRNVIYLAAVVGAIWFFFFRVGTKK